MRTAILSIVILSGSFASATAQQAPRQVREGRLVLPAAPTPAVPQATISGVIRDTRTQAPVEGATVTLSRTSRMAQMAAILEERTPPETPAPEKTGADGRFSFKVDPDSYRLTVARSGYVPFEWGDRDLDERNRNGAGITLGPGEFRRGLELDLTPTSSVAGTIRDNAGRSLAGVLVQVLRDATSDEIKLLQPTEPHLVVVAETESDARGEYRIAALEPGAYVVAAGSALGPQAQLVSGAASYAYSIYPETVSRDHGARAEFSPGGNLTVDLMLRPGRSYRIRGIAVDGATGGTPGDVRISVTSYTPLGARRGMSSRITNGGVLRSTYSEPAVQVDYSAERGAFELSNVLPGTYILSVTQTAGAGQPLGGNATVVIESADVDDVVITLSPAAQPQTR